MKACNRLLVGGIALSVSLWVVPDVFGQSRVYDHTLIVPETPLVDSFEDEDDYNLRIGPVDITVGIGLTVEYNDNITLAPDELKESDFILTPWIDLDAIWRVSDLNEVHFSLGIGYHKYLENSEYDTKGIILTPTSALAFIFYIGDFRFTLSDSFSYQEDPYELVTLSNNATYRRLENQIGLQVDWNGTEELVITGGYSHYNLWARDEEYKTLERAVDTLYFRPSYQITPTANLGLSVTGSFISFTDSLRANARSLLVGPTLEMALTEYTSFRLEVGYQYYDTDNSTLAIYDGSTNSYYYRGEIANRLSEAFSHRLSFSYFTEVGYESSYYNIYQTEYGLDWHVMEGIRLRPALFWEHYTTAGGPDEKGDRLGFVIGFGYQIMPSVTLDVGYRYLVKNSNFDPNDYTQNSVTVTLGYRF